MQDLIRLGEIAAPVRRAGRDFGATIRDDRVALRGLREAHALPAGPETHSLDAIAETDFETRVTRPAGLVLHLVFDGQVTATIGGAPMAVARAPGAPVQLVYSATARHLPFVRRARRGERLRKVTVSVGWDWLEARGIGREALLGGRELVQGARAATPEEAALGERLVALDAGGGATALAREALVLALLSRCVEHLAQGPALRPEEAERLARMEACALTPGPVPDLAEIARAGSMSLSSAQRLFHRAHGVPARARIRELRLCRAHEALCRGESVAAAAHLAGFLSAESFATAFRRRFGLTPSALHARGAR